METTPQQILRTYVTLILLSTFATSFIWGINTLFLLDAGLSITEAFTANAFFTVGQVLFEVPTGVVADTVGRRASYLLGSATLFASTIFYLVLWQQHAAFWLWAISSALLGLGYTFFSGAVEAWLVDALQATGYKQSLESAFAKGQIATGIAMLTGTVAGGVIAQYTNLGIPYILRAVVLAVTFAAAFLLMKDVGFTPRRRVSVLKEVKGTLKSSFDHGFRNPPVRWLMLTSPFTAGVGIYAFYAMQPYLLELYGSTDSYAIAGLAAAIVAGAQIGGGLLVVRIRKLFAYRTSLLAAAIGLSAASMAAIGLAQNFWVVLIILVIWAMLFAAVQPVHQAYLNGLIASGERATVLSSDNLLGSSGGAVFQPLLGKSAEAWGYPASYVISAGISLIALPFILLAKRQKAASDRIIDKVVPEDKPVPVHVKK
ncbi:MAG TPA: MFS transporter [Candidatus Limnocylindria bacterium]|nr:MFS transporter [Candidatus Limnocylindria bacterium]